MGRNRNEREGKVSESARWRCRPAVSAAVGLAVVALPLSLAVGVAVLIELLVSEPSSSVGRAVWWIGVLSLSIVVLVVCAQVARQALSLSVLLKMGLVFPGEAPKRVAVARRAASTRNLGRRLDEWRSKGVADEPVVAAERIVELAACLSAHDRKTRGHAERVGALADLVADELRLPDPDRDRLRWAALLHDVGKLAVHPDILNKQGPLSSSEQHLVRRHPLEGARLTEPLSDWLGDWASTIAEHHERHDGTGYPFGLAGDAISLGGRIVAVVDAYDVMTSVHSYKRPISPDAARAELARLAGSQFDPAVVRAFLAIPVRRLRRLLPLAWIGSLPFGDDGPELAVLGRTAAALIVVGSIVGLTSWRPWAAQDGVVALAAHAGGSAGGQSSTAVYPSSGASMPRATDGDKGSPGSQTGANAGPSTKSRSGGGSADQRDRGGTVRGALSWVYRPGGASTSSGNKQKGATGFPGPRGADPSPSTTSPPPTTTTSPPPPTTTTSPPPPTTTTAPPPTTTTTSLPQAPSPPTGLSLTATCTSYEIGPEITLEWTDSTSSSVTGYEILRSWNGSDYSAIADVEAGATTYSDSSYLWLGTTYWYEVEALSPEGSATSAPAQTTTPITCES
jgi:putative nucleotidyltransferase with HDIG domain